MYKATFTEEDGRREHHFSVSAGSLEEATNRVELVLSRRGFHVQNTRMFFEVMVHEDESKRAVVLISPLVGTPVVPLTEIEHANLSELLSALRSKPLPTRSFRGTSGYGLGFETM